MPEPLSLLDLALTPRPWTIGDDEVHVWLLTPALVAGDAIAAAARSVLNADEIARWNAFRFSRDRTIFLATRLLARGALAGYTGISPAALAFEAAPNGKPTLVRANASMPDIRFNLSNTRGLVALAVTVGRDVGVDVEEVRQIGSDLGELEFAPSERALLHAASSTARPSIFFALWTLKEAFLKARGMGLSLSLDQFAIGLDPPRLLPYGVLGDADASRWRFARADVGPGHAFAVCIDAGERTWNEPFGFRVGTVGDELIASILSRASIDRASE